MAISIALRSRTVKVRRWGVLHAACAVRAHTVMQVFDDIIGEAKKLYPVLARALNDYVTHASPLYT
jgi:hypothetical protein